MFLLGRKVGMTQVADADGRAIPVTLVQAGPCRVLRIKSLQDEVKDVRLSERLTSSPACLVGEPGDLSAHVEELLRPKVGKGGLRPLGVAVRYRGL